MGQYILSLSKFVLAYARKQNQSAIFEWVEEDRGWFWHAGDYLAGLQKKSKGDKHSYAG